MRKMPTLFVRDEARRGRPVTPVFKPECLWVGRGEGVATRKLDGMNVKVVAGVLYRRRKPAEGAYDEAANVPARRLHAPSLPIRPARGREGPGVGA